MTDVGQAFTSLMRFLPPDKAPDLHLILDTFARLGPANGNSATESSVMDLLNSQRVVDAFKSVMGYWSQNCPGALA